MAFNIRKYLTENKLTDTSKRLDENFTMKFQNGEIEIRKHTNMAGEKGFGIYLNDGKRFAEVEMSYEEFNKLITRMRKEL